MVIKQLYFEFCVFNRKHINMKSLNNVIFARIFHYSGLKLNENGLWLNIDKNKCHKVPEILISNDFPKILSLIEVDAEKLKSLLFDGVFEYLYQNPFFTPYKFIIDASNGESVWLKELSQFLSNKNLKFSKISAKNITLEMLFKHFKEEGFEEKYNKSNVVLNTNTDVYKSISGKTILKYYPDYNKRQFDTVISFFINKYFKTQLDFQYFMCTKTEKEIVNEFIEGTKLIA